MDQRCYFKLKGGLNFLCAAAGISLLTNAVIKLCKYGEKEAKRKEAVEAVKTIDELMKKLDRYETSKTESEEESK